MRASPTPPSASISFGATPLPDDGSPKLLFDEHLAPRLAADLAEVYPDSSSVRAEGLEGASDTVVWSHAARAGFVLVTKDEDFHRLSVFHGFPPKVVWLRIGNCSTEEIADLLRTRRADIDAFVRHREAVFLALG